MAAEEHSLERRQISVVNSSVGEKDGQRLKLGACDSLLPGLIGDVALNCLAWVPRSDYPSLSCVNKKYNKLINGSLRGIAIVAAQAPPLVVVVDNELFTLGYLTNMVKKYDKAKKKWEVMGRLPPMVDSSNGWGLAFKPCGDQLLVFCGQRGCNGESIMVNSWCPKSGAKDGNLDWKVVGVKENVGVFVYNCAVMGC